VGVDVVRVEESDNLAGGEREALVEGVVDAAIRLNDQVGERGLSD
jgi:hypothetical protein